MDFIVLWTSDLRRNFTVNKTRHVNYFTVQLVLVLGTY